VADVKPRERGFWAAETGATLARVEVAGGVMDRQGAGGEREEARPRPDQLVAQLTQLLSAGNRELRRLTAELEDLQLEVQAPPPRQPASASRPA
jgi:hypothetical protein